MGADADGLTKKGARKLRKNISLALQGGGLHGAFWISCLRC